MAFTLRSLASSAIRRHVTSKSTNFLGGRSFGSVSGVSSGALSSSLASKGRPLLAGTPGLAFAITTAKCEEKPPASSIDEHVAEKQSSGETASAPDVDLHSRADSLYSDGNSPKSTSCSTRIRRRKTTPNCCSDWRRPRTRCRSRRRNRKGGESSMTRRS